MIILDTRKFIKLTRDLINEHPPPLGISLTDYYQNTFDIKLTFQSIDNTRQLTFKNPHHEVLFRLKYADENYYCG